MNISSSSLFHYTKSFETLISILENGFEHRPVEEDLPFIPPQGSIFNVPGIIRYDFKFNVVCFTDIPLRNIKAHIDQYGKYVIALSKDWAKSVGVTPIRYVHYDTPDIKSDEFFFIRSFIEGYPESKNEIVRVANELIKEMGEDPITQKELDNLPEKFKHLLRGYEYIIKDICSQVYSHLGLMRRSKGPWKDRNTGETIERNFYDEREWRSLDINGEKGNLKFTANDISKIFIAEGEERSKLVSFFENNKSNFELENIDKIKYKIHLVEEYFKDI